jgi:hypothetical protein
MWDIDQLSGLISAIGSLIQGIIWPLLIVFLVAYFDLKNIKLEDIKNILKNVSEVSIKAGATGLEVAAKRSIESAAFAGAAMQKHKSLSNSEVNERDIKGIVSVISGATISKSTSKTAVLWVDDTPSNNNFVRV